MCSTSGRTRGAGGCRGGEAGAEAPWMALSAATAGPRCAPIIMDYVRRRPRAGNSAVRSRRTGAAARPQGPKGRNTVNSYLPYIYKVRPHVLQLDTAKRWKMVRLSGSSPRSMGRTGGFRVAPKGRKAQNGPSRHTFLQGGAEVRKVLLGAHPPRAQPHRCQNVFEDRAQRLTLRCRMRFLTRTGCCTYFWFPQNGSAVVSRCGFVSFFSR